MEWKVRAACLVCALSVAWTGVGWAKPPAAGLGTAPTAGQVSQIRVGVHPTHVRIVLDVTGPMEWSSTRDADGCGGLLLPGAALAPGVQTLELARGPVRRVSPAQRPSGVEVKLECQPGPVRTHITALARPDRVVLDVWPASGNDVRPANEPISGAKPERVPALRASNPGEAGRGPTREPAASGLTVVLDPGHGGHDFGAIGPNGLAEKEVVLDLALRLAQLLRDRLHVRVLLTRSQDVFVPLQERTAFANRAQADFLVSLHLNGAGRRGAVGFETFFFTREPSDSDARASAQRENLVLETSGTPAAQDDLLRTTLADMAVTRDMKESSNLAEAILSALDRMLKIENRGVKSGPFYVLATAAMPAVLVESAFITNPREERKLKQPGYRQRIAEALLDGIARFKLRYEQRVGGRSGAAPSVGS